MTTPTDDNPSAPRHEAELLESFISEQREFNDELRKLIDESKRLYETMNSDLGVLKGGHAISSVLGNVSRVARNLGYHFISQLPEQELGAFANLAARAGKPSGDVASFRNADIVMLVLDRYNQPYYLAVEVSYTVESEDIRRANRNAKYLQQFTSMPSRAAVVGVHISDWTRREAEAKNVLWHVLRPT